MNRDSLQDTSNQRVDESPTFQLTDLANGQKNANHERSRSNPLLRGTTPKRFNANWASLNRNPRARSVRRRTHLIAKTKESSSEDAREESIPKNLKKRTSAPMPKKKKRWECDLQSAAEIVGNGNYSL